MRERGLKLDAHIRVGDQRKQAERQDDGKRAEEPREREVEIESATPIGGGRKRADYLFRTDKRDRFVCEAKKPAEELSSRYAFQAKRYAWNKGVPLAVLTDFEELKIFVVGGKPYLDEPKVGEWKSWHFRQYPLITRELWDLLARDRIDALERARVEDKVEAHVTRDVRVGGGTLIRYVFEHRHHRYGRRARRRERARRYLGGA